MSSAKPTRGRIVTFYSYKGGTGRSLALANVAWILANNGLRVLVIDWDLEAPGLHRYFAPFLVDKELRDTKGVTDFVWDFANEAMTPAPEGEDDSRWFEPLADFRRYAVALRYEFPRSGALDFVPAGRQDSTYGQRVSTFDWKRFYEDMGGGVFLQVARDKSCDHYDYILIDSRTGVSDTSGVCTVHLPDTLVACFTANNQNIRGTAGVVANVRSLWARDPDRADRPNRILPLLTRVDPFERNKLELRRKLADDEFTEILRDLDGPGKPGHRRPSELPYIPYYSYEETLAPFADRPGDTEAVLLPSLERLAALITDGRVTRLGAAPGESIRRQVLARFEGRDVPAVEIASETVLGERSDIVLPSVRAVLERADYTGLNAHKYHVFLSHSGADTPAVEELARRLMREGITPWFDKWHLIPGDFWQPRNESALQECQTCAVFVGPGGIGPWQHDEMRLAIERRVAGSSAATAAGTSPFRVIPVLLPGSERPNRSQLPAFLTATTWVEFRTTLDDVAAFQRMVCGIRGIEPGTGPDNAPFVGLSPYRGLMFFDVEHAPFFFGREALTEWMVTALRPASPSEGHRFLAIVGPSGAGKSSLARAGLLAALKKGALDGSAAWPTVILNPGRDPVESLASARAGLEGETPTAEGAQRLMRELKAPESTLHLTVRLALRHAPPSFRLVLLVDQFEEVFTLCDDDSIRRGFFANLLYAASLTGGQTIVLLTMRADFYGNCAAYPALAAAMSEHQVLVGPMTEDELRRAIGRPARLAGAEVEQGLVEMLLRDVVGRPGALPLLQFTLQELWNRREARRLTVESYQVIGTLQGVLNNRADSVLARFSDAERALCRRIFLRLIQPGEGVEDTKRRAMLSELIPSGTDRKPVESVLERLADAQLVVIAGALTDQHETTVDVAHEALVRGWGQLRHWIDADRTADCAPSPLHRSRP